MSLRKYRPRFEARRSADGGCHHSKIASAWTGKVKKGGNADSCKAHQISLPQHNEVSCTEEGRPAREPPPLEYTPARALILFGCYGHEPWIHLAESRWLTLTLEGRAVEAE